jgi:glutamate--cysteine ligase
MDGETEDIKAENRRLVAAYFEGGFRPKDEARHLGVEAEHFVVHDDGTPVSYTGEEGNFGMRDVLEYLSAFYTDTFYNLKGELIGLANETASITLEPAAQLEISVAPYADVCDIARSYRMFREAVDPYLSLRGAHLIAHGYHPTTRALDMPLIPKERYRLMNEHFARIGSHGERMMRASASTQVSIDFTDEEDAVRKFRVAAAIGPVLAAITDNTPAFEGEPNQRPIARLSLWRQVDDARCRVVPGTFDEGFGFQAYADWMLGTSPHLRGPSRRGRPGRPRHPRGGRYAGGRRVCGCAHEQGRHRASHLHVLAGRPLQALRGDPPGRLPARCPDIRLHGAD